MALSIDDRPYEWAPRGQKLIYRVSSDNTTQDGFKYGVEITNLTNGKSYFFLYDPEPAGSLLYFDLNPLLVMSNEEYSMNPHTPLFDAPVAEPQGKGWDQYELTFTEWWIEFGELTEQIGSGITDTQYVFNAYYQQYDGYKPDVESGDTEVRFALNSATESRAWSDRYLDTHRWDYSDFFGITDAILIPCFSNDYGSLAVQSRLAVMETTTASQYQIIFKYGDPQSPTTATPFGYSIPPLTPFLYLGVYPQNLSDTPSIPSPATYPDWLYYTLFLRDVGGSSVANKYVFYNAERLGQYDCRHERVRLAWVSSRAGYDYFNFIKKNEESNQIERKQFVRSIFNGTEAIFDRNMRSTIDRQNFVNRSITIQSDWIQEEEFVFLRSLLVSNQVSIIRDDGTTIPVSIDDTNYIEKRGRDGKLVNLTLKLNYSFEYWS